MTLSNANAGEQGQHTRGPWRTFERPTGIEILCGDRLAPINMPSNGIRVAEVRFKRVGRGGQFAKSKTDEANARLISAAPEMLDLLNLFERSVEYEIRSSRTDGDEEGARMKTITLNLIRACITKATGATTS